MRRKKRIAKLFCLHLEAAIFFFYDVRSINRTKMRRSIQLSDKRDDEQHKYLFATLQHFRSLFIPCWKRKLIKIQSIPISVKEKKNSHAFHFDSSSSELRNQWNVSWRGLRQFEWVWLKERFEGFDGAFGGIDGLQGGLGEVWGVWHRRRLDWGVEKVWRGRRGFEKVWGGWLGWEEVWKALSLKKVCEGLRGWRGLRGLRG